MSLDYGYNFRESEKKWQLVWGSEGVYKYDQGSAAEKFVIDTPPPTISGSLHMGHVFSYCHADFVARFQRMSGKNVFYPIGFDDNGLPTERLVEQQKQIKASETDRAEFTQMCRDISQKSSQNFFRLFSSLGLSFDWSLVYHTSDQRCLRLSQASFVDLYNKDGETDTLYVKNTPCYWDCADRTAIAQAEIVEQEMESEMHYINFQILDPNQNNIGQAAIATTRPELMHACLAVFFHPDDSRYRLYNSATDKPYSAITACGVRVPLIANQSVSVDKGTGLVMFCTFGDDLDLEWFRSEHTLGGINFKFINSPQAIDGSGRVLTPKLDQNSRISGVKIEPAHANSLSTELWYVYDRNLYDQFMEQAVGKYVIKARKHLVEMFARQRLIQKSEKITHTVKCAERSGSPLEILPSLQWYISLLPYRSQLTQQAKKCKWHPDNMAVRIHQWIDGLKSDWCVSRQRYHGVPIPAWYALLPDDPQNPQDLSQGINKHSKFITLVASFDDLPVDPNFDLPGGMKKIRLLDDGVGVEAECQKDFIAAKNTFDSLGNLVAKKGSALFVKGARLTIYPERSVLDTWATSSLTPQISANGLKKELAEDKKTFSSLFPADLRPQAHEIIRTWAFYTIAKSFFHNNSIPWRNLMISGWCLAKDKSKMSKSKGNIVEPQQLLETKGADVVRYWASSSRLGADITVSEDVMHNGHRLVNKILNAAKFIKMHIEIFNGNAIEKNIEAQIITEPMDLWIISKFVAANKKYKASFLDFDYHTARQTAEEFFWFDFCDNYLELIKTRIYANDANGGEETPGRLSAASAACHSFMGALAFFAPFLPYATEEVYRELFVAQGSIHTANNWFSHDGIVINENAVALGEACVDILGCVRKLKAELNVSIKKPCVLFVSPTAENAPDELSALQQAIGVSDLKNAANAEEIIWSNNEKHLNNQTTVGAKYNVSIRLL